jgi:aryl-alcohol dehydrogenase-like predicted oxidoreductase
LDRLQQLGYDSLRGDPRSAVAIALRFTSSVPGVHTMIVGTTKPGCWRETAALLEAGPLPPEQFKAIGARRCKVAEPGWAGQL